MNFMNRFFKRNTVTLIRPFIYQTSSIGSEAKKMIFLLMIQFFLLLYTSSFSAVFVILSAVCASVLANLISIWAFGHKVYDHHSWYISIVQGLITGFLLPSNYPILSVFVITLCTMLTVKHFFGGFSYAWVNPSVFSVVILWIIGSNAFPGLGITRDLLLMRNPSLQLIQNGYFNTYGFDGSMTDSLNNAVFNLFGVTIPNGYISLFCDSGSSIPAFRFNLCTIISSIILFSDDYMKTVVPFIFLIVYSILVRFLTPLFFGGISASGDILLALLSGGTLFFAVFIIGWYGTTPVTLYGKIFYGFIIGVLAFFISGCGTSSCGMIFTVLLSNIISVLIQQFENRRDRINLKKKLSLAENNGVKK